MKKKKINLKKLILLPFYIAIGLMAWFLFLMDDIVRFLIKKYKKIVRKKISSELDNKGEYNENGFRES